MESVIKISRSEANYLWVRFDQGICKDCGEYLYFKYHGNPRILNIEGREESVINCYYECRNPFCKNEEIVVAKHPEILYKKLYSRSTFALVIYLRYIKKFSVKQILEELPYLKIGMCYEMINTYRAAARVRADERIAQKFPPGSKIRVSIDAMEPEKGQPALYTVREVSEDELLGARFLEDSSADAIYGLLKEIEEKYGVKFVGFVSDKQTGIVAMRDKYYPKVEHQYCVVHFLDNVTKEMREIDNTLKKNLRSDVRGINTFKTIKKKARKPASDLAENELTVLSDTRRALLAVVNQKKKDKFELAGTAIFENLSKATDWLCDFMERNLYFESSRKFQVLITHMVKRLQAILKNYRSTYRFVLQANQYLHDIFASVIDPHPKHPKRAFKKVIKSWKKILALKSLSKKMRGLL
ncbi:MAG: transposase, partial [Promethearchaeota archaeon]